MGRGEPQSMEYTFLIGLLKTWQTWAKPLNLNLNEKYNFSMKLVPTMIDESTVNGDATCPKD